MVEPISAAVVAGRMLVKVLWNVKEVCQKKRNNDDIVRELGIFITNLDADLVSLKHRTPRSNSAVWAAGALKQDLDRAAEYVRQCLDRGYIKSFWSVSIIYDKLKRIREEVVTSFQTKLQIIIFDVVIEEQSKQEEFRANLSRVQGAFIHALSDFAIFRREWKDEVHQVKTSLLELRAELKALLQPVLDGVAAGGNRNMDLNTAIALTRSTEPQSSDSEKFFADVLANLEGRRDWRPQEGQPSAWNSSSAEDPLFEDPITSEVMCDPVKCSDGRTYDRWTIIDNRILVSPFDKSLPEFSILVDDISVRMHLFKRFPEQEEMFHARRLRHRQEALDHASEEEYGDALEKLDQVLQWARSDQECIAKRDEILPLLTPLPAAVVELLDSLESHSPSLSALPPPASSWGQYFEEGEHGALGEFRRQLRLRIMTAIGNCRSLRIIHLNPSRETTYSVRDEEATALLNGLKRNPELESLSLCWFKGFGTTEACIALAAAVVRPSRRLADLDMIGVGLSAEGLGHISAALRSHTNSGSGFRSLTLYLDENDIGDAAGAQHIAGILTGTRALQGLGLHDIGMDEAGAAVIADAMARSTTLQRLRIGYDRQKSPHQAEMLIPLLTALTRGGSSSSESESGSEFHSPCAPASFNLSITQLRIVVTGVSGGREDSAAEAGLAGAVATMLGSMTTLKILEVTSFFVTRGLWALPHNNSITKLELVHDRSLDDDELDPPLLVPILQDCKKLQVLKLTFQKPYGPSKFTRDLFQGVKLNPCIKWLVLDGWEGLDDDMFEELIRSLPTNTNLEGISIKGTSWEKQGKGQRLARALRDTRMEPPLLALLAELESDSPALQELPSVTLWESYFDCKCQDRKCSHRGKWQWEVRLRLLTAVGKCRTLRKISLNPLGKRGYSVRQVEALALLSGLEHNLVLQELNLCGYKGFGTTAACLQALSAVIERSCRSLHFLGLQDVGLSAEGLGDIAAAIESCKDIPVLSRLFLCGNDIGNAVGGEHLDRIVTNSPMLHTLWISEIGMDQQGSVRIAEALGQCKYTTLWQRTKALAQLRIGDYVPRNPTQPASMFLNPLLQALVWPELGAENPPAALRYSVRKLTLQCPGGQEAVEPGLGEALARVLRSNRSLNELTIASFFVTRGLGALRENNHITQLHVLHTQRSDDDDMDPMLISILQECNTVQELRLQFLKPFGPSRFTKAFFQGLCNNRSIETLVLDGWDGLDDHMFHDLMRSLGPNSNSVLNNISIKGTSWESQGKGKHIQNALIQNTRKGSDGQLAGDIATCSN